MKTNGFILGVLTILLSPVINAQTQPVPLTPAQQKIAWAQAAIKESPGHTQPYNDLAVAYVRRVRETGDVSYYDQAELAAQKSLKISPDNLDGQKAKIMILIGRKDFGKALQLAKALNKKVPDDVLVYGFIADAEIELGIIKDAEEAAQWMLDMRPGNVPGLLRGARLRQIFGDPEGSMDFFSQAYQQTPPTQVEDQAWILTQMGDVQLSIGKVDEATKLFRSALEKFPSYYLAMQSLSRAETGGRQAMENAQPGSAVW
jgi:tetratricopeptide (TPR) repeat protein